MTSQEVLDYITGKIPEQEVWRIEIPKIPKEAKYDGPPQATILKRSGDYSWDALGYLMLSANPECQVALKELVELANEALVRRRTTQEPSDG